MILYIVKRLLSALPILLVVTFFIFSIVAFTPGDPASLLVGDDASSAELEAVRQRLNLDQPFFVRYATWLWAIVRGDLGSSLYTNEPVLELLLDRLEPTVSLMALSLAISIVIAIPCAVHTAWNANGLFDRALTSFASVSFAVPTFVIGYLLAYFIGLRAGLLPVQGYTPLSQGFLPWLRHLILPALALSTAYIALIARTAQTAMMAELRQDYIRTARAKGLRMPTILFIHTLKNASVPVITVIGIGIASLISGSVVTESVFTIPGLGRLTSDAIMRRDIPVIQGITLIFAVSYVVINILIDLIYVAVDPRVNFAQGSR